MSNLTFENVKVGDKLMIEGRSFGYSRYEYEPFRMKEWLAGELAKAEAKKKMDVM